MRLEQRGSVNTDECMSNSKEEETSTSSNLFKVSRKGVCMTNSEEDETCISSNLSTQISRKGVLMGAV